MKEKDKLLASKSQ